MKCPKCGNEILDEENFCGKCGQRVSDEIVKNDSVNKKEPIKIKFTHLMIVIGIVIIIAGATISMNIFSNDSLIQKVQNASDKYNNNSSLSQQSTNAKSTQENKEYYDFIDKNFKTFNFTEDELVNRYMQGKSYISQGFERIKGTEENTFLYTKVNIQGVQFLSITNCTANNKVSKIELGLVVTGLNQNQLKQYSYNMFNNLMGNALYPDKNNSDEIQKYQTILQEVLNGKSMDKGLKYTGNIENSGNNGYSITVKLEVI